MGLGSDWKEIVSQLESSYYCIMPDLPGHGESGTSMIESSFGWNEAVDTIIGLFDHLKLPEVNLVGYSMGGRLALATALKIPSRIAVLVLESTNPGIENEFERKARQAADDEEARELEKVGVERFLDEWYSTPMWESLRRFPDKMERLRRSRRVHQVRALSRALRELSVARQTPVWDKLQELPMRVLLVSGALDHKYSRITHRMSELIRHSRWKEIGDAGHNTHLERPEAFVRALTSFLKESAVDLVKQGKNREIV